MTGYKKYFIKSIKETYPDNFEEIVSTLETHYQYISKDTAFAKTSKNPIDKRLDFCSYFLALIATLDNRGESYNNIRKICLVIVTAYVRPRNKIQALIRKLPP
jgi:hypothetical protein